MNLYFQFFYTFFYFYFSLYFLNEIMDNKNKAQGLKVTMIILNLIFLFLTFVTIVSDDLKEFLYLSPFMILLNLYYVYCIYSIKIYSETEEFSVSEKIIINMNKSTKYDREYNFFERIDNWIFFLIFEIFYYLFSTYFYSLGLILNGIIFSIPFIISCIGGINFYFSTNHGGFEKYLRERIGSFFLLKTKKESEFSKSLYIDLFSSILLYFKSKQYRNMKRKLYIDQDTTRLFEEFMRELGLSYNKEYADKLKFVESIKMQNTIESIKNAITEKNHSNINYLNYYLVYSYIELCLDKGKIKVYDNKVFADGIEMKFNGNAKLIENKNSIIREENASFIKYIFNSPNISKEEKIILISNLHKNLQFDLEKKYANEEINKLLEKLKQVEDFNNEREQVEDLNNQRIIFIKKQTN